MRIVGGQLRGKKLLAPDTLQTRPTSDRLRETIFNVLAHNPEIGRLPNSTTRVLDAFAGTGALGLEALSRGAQHATFLDQDTSIVRENIVQCQMPDKTALYTGDFLKTSLQGPFDLIFLDPPYGKGLIESALSHLLLSHVMSAGTVLVLESQKNEGLVIPDDFVMITERVSRNSKIMILRLRAYTHQT